MNNRIHIVEYRRRDQLAGRWGEWLGVAISFPTRDVAVLYRDTLLADSDDDVEARVATFVRKRTYAGKRREH